MIIIHHPCRLSRSHEPPIETQNGFGNPCTTLSFRPQSIIDNWYNFHEAVKAPRQQLSASGCREAVHYSPDDVQRITRLVFLHMQSFPWGAHPPQLPCSLIGPDLADFARLTLILPFEKNRLAFSVAANQSNTVTKDTPCGRTYQLKHHQSYSSPPTTGQRSAKKRLRQISQPAVWEAVMWGAAKLLCT